MSWVRHWVYTGDQEALGDDLVVLPLPDFGSGTEKRPGVMGLGYRRLQQERCGDAKFLDYQ